MKITNYETKNPFAFFLTGMALAVVLGLMVALSTPAFALGGGGGGGGSAPAPRVTKIESPVAEPEEEIVVARSPIVDPDEDKFPVASESKTEELEEEEEETLVTGDQGEDEDEDKTETKPDERTTEFPEPEIVETTVGFKESSSDLAENDGRLEILVRIGKPLTQSVTLNVSVAGEATRGVDYKISSTSLTIPASANGGTITLIGLDDDADEEDETVTLTLTGTLPEGVTFGTGTTTHTVTIIDDDVAEEIEVVKKPDEDQDGKDKPVGKPDDVIPGNDAEEVVEEEAEVTVGFDTAATRATEGDDVTLRVTLSEPISESLELYLHESGPVTLEDFRLPAKVVVEEGAVLGEATLSIVDDDLVESDETITISLDARELPDGMVIGNGSHTVTIVDDDRGEISEVADEDSKQADPVVGFTASTSEIHEGSRMVQIKASVTPPVSESIRLSYQISGSATRSFSMRNGKEGDDYVILWTNPAIPSKQAGANLVQLIVFDDAVDEEDETITITIDGALPEGVTFGTTTHTVTIIDDDDDIGDYVTVGFAESVSIVNEDAGSVAVEVVLSEALDDPLTVSYGTRPPAWSGRNNQPGDIYLHSRSLTFQPGETSRSFLFDIADDRLNEWTEIGIFVLSGDLPEGVKFGRKTHTMDLYDNETGGSPVVEDHRDGMYVKEYDGNDISLTNEGNVVKIEALNYSAEDARITIENIGTVVTDIIGRNHTSRSAGVISIKNSEDGVVGGNVIGKHHSEGNILIENQGEIAGDIRAVHFNVGDISIENHKTGDVGGDIEATHYGNGNISVTNRENVRAILLSHLGNGVVRFNGDIFNSLNIVGNYEGSDGTQLNFYVNSDGSYSWMNVEGDVTGQSRVSLVVNRDAVIDEDTHFSDLIEVDEGYDAEADSFTGSQTIGAFNYVLEHESEDGHAWSFVNKGLSDTAEKSAKIPDDIEKDMENPPKPKVGPDGKPELGLWGGLDSSRTDIGLGLPAFVSNDDYHVGSQVQYYLQDDRSGIRALVETEYNFDVMNFRITPQARLTWTRVGFEDFVGPHRERISLVDGDTVDLRLGVSFDNEYRFSNGLGYLYGGLSIQAPIDGKTSVKVSGVNVVNERNDVSVDGKLGLSYEWDEGYAVYGEASALHRDDDDEVRANLGVRIDF
ncbi:MAG: autotransporter outer membrane beta-barrel domain-containing protein [Hyphomicrobiales bacterium]|nr:autotransporter outer membrane beta-barrel domain-containing protein [Hyphomicrobiales bacterium]